MAIRGGHEKNYQNFMNEIQKTDLQAAAKILDLEYSNSDSILIPFLGRTYTPTLHKNM